MIIISELRKEKNSKRIVITLNSEIPIEPQRRSISSFQSFNDLHFLQVSFLLSQFLLSLYHHLILLLSVFSVPFLFEFQLISRFCFPSFPVLCKPNLTILSALPS